MIMKKNKKPVDATVGMAVMDAFPVLFFAVSMVLIGLIFYSVIFDIGAVLCILAGAGKVVWKFGLAVSGKNRVILNKQFRYLMIGGFVLIIISLIVRRPSVTVIWKNVSSFPCNILIIIGIAGMVVMGILGARLDHSRRKANWIEQSVNLVAQICIVLAIVIIWYGSDYYNADLGQDFTGSDSVQVTEIKNGLYFDGEGTDTALIFYPGAKVEYTAYEPLMEELAEEGVDCFLVEMPYNLAIFGVNRADAIISEYSYDSWYISGHSLGGAMAASYAAKNQDKMDGVILLGAYATKSLGDLPVLAVYGSEDGVLNREKLEEGRAYSDNYTEVCIDGGNHARFGCYGEQTGDGTATISREEQRQETIESIMDLINRE